MSILVDTASLIPGAIVCGSPGLGVPFAVVRANTGSGDAGPGVVWGDWDSATDDAVEARIQIERWPVNGTFLLEEDGRGSYSGGADYAIGRLFADGVDKGTKVISFFGGAPASGLASITMAGGVASAEALGVPQVQSSSPQQPVAGVLLGVGGIASLEAVSVPARVSDGQLVVRPKTPAARRLTVWRESRRLIINA